MGLKPHKEDVGQTLGKYGFGPGCYLVLPILGPSTARDSFGLFADTFVDPFAHVTLRENELLGSSGNTLDYYSVKATTAVDFGCRKCSAYAECCFLRRLCRPVWTFSRGTYGMAARCCRGGRTLLSTSLGYAGHWRLADAASEPAACGDSPWRFVEERYCISSFFSARLGEWNRFFLWPFLRFPQYQTVFPQGLSSQQKYTFCFFINREPLVLCLSLIHI